MILCIAEKPSVGRDIAKVLGATVARDGYMEGNGYCVTWTFGHLCALLDPDEYNPQWKHWNLSTLPMVPPRFGIKVTQDKGIQKQFNTIQRLIQQADTLINCGDAGQEGELIQRWVQQKAGCHCPVQRLWISSLTEEAIREGFQNLRPQSDYLHLYEAGLMRAIGDWLLGMNATRAYTLRYRDRLTQMANNEGKALAGGGQAGGFVAVRADASGGTDASNRAGGGGRAIGTDALQSTKSADALQSTSLQGGKLQRQVLSIGRVQTPTLALIVSRQEEIEHFVPQTYWELKTTYRNTTFAALVRKNEETDEASTADAQASGTDALQSTKSADALQSTSLQGGASQGDARGIDKIASRAIGEQICDQLAQQPLTILSVEKKKGKEAPPRLFDLTSLQVECNKRYAFTADETLKLIQSLYEKKVTTYPRVDTTYLSDDIYPKCAATLRGIEPYFADKIAPLHGKPLPKSKKVFDNKKVTDHHAIIPTGQAPNNLTEAERKVFDLVALHFIAVFYPDCQVSNTTVMASVSCEGMPNNEVIFKATGRQILQPGWRTVLTESAPNQPDNTNTDAPAPNTLPDFKKGETGPHKPALLEKQTTPPQYYTEATLLRAMETAGKTVADEDLRDALKENGIGRPSTRAAIIEKLFDRHYLVRSGKRIKATPTGVELIHILHTPLLKSAELTGQWERKLRQIERGEFTAQQFLDELKVLTQSVVKDVKTSKVGMLCPVCRKGFIVRGKTAYGCSRWREGCTYREPLENT